MIKCKLLNVLSLFDGCSCGQVALERAGFKVDTYYASEIDNYAIHTCQKNYPNTIQLGDIMNIDFTKFEGKIDVIIGGPPCQKFSIANKNREKNLDGEGGKLLKKFIEAVQVIKPKYFLMENVPGMDKAIQTHVNELLGVSPILINSALVSAQQRKRLYWTNIPNVQQPVDKCIYLNDIIMHDAVEKMINYKESAIFRYIKNQHNYSNPIRIGEVNGSTSQGNRVYSTQGKSICLSANGGGMGANTGLYKIDLPNNDYVVRKLYPIECERLQTLPDNYTACVQPNQRIKQCGNGWTVDVIAHILKHMYF